MRRQALGHGLPPVPVRLHVSAPQREQAQRDQARHEAAEVLHLPDHLAARLHLDELVAMRPRLRRLRAHEGRQLTHHLEEELPEPRFAPAAHQPLFQQVLVVRVALPPNCELRENEPRPRHHLRWRKERWEQATHARGLDGLEGVISDVLEARVPRLPSEVSPLKLDAPGLREHGGLGYGIALGPLDVPLRDRQARRCVERRQQMLAQLACALEEHAPAREGVRAQQASQRADRELKDRRPRVLQAEAKVPLHELRRALELCRQVEEPQGRQGVEDSHADVAEAVAALSRHGPELVHSPSVTSVAMPSMEEGLPHLLSHGGPPCLVTHGRWKGRGDSRSAAGLICSGLFTAAVIALPVLHTRARGLPG
eukprot:CAMPEP_0179081546 /NCGR_PEP_ID=MMETSP0796-20121207/36721_1 /TAXON_ID=73915 /ORGANISM="Pyrodinium bahamense, Strain pbaha01" /LENGTH=367 /DNA_ID=CAMNT_0020778931 /DNA_START=363 /DNA_END=1463 /DNA_ORIENTATION=+